MDEEKTIVRQLQVRNKYGIHARPAALLVKMANRFTCDIVIEHKGIDVSAKSIMGLLTIEGHVGAVLTVTATGADAQEAVSSIEDLFDQNFLED